MHKHSNKNHRKNAFTLAEVLITIGIIGIVAALTLPSLVQNAREQGEVARIKKFYSIFSQAYTMAIQDNGPFTTWGLNDSKQFVNENGQTSYTEETAEDIDKFFQIMDKYLKKANYEKVPNIVSQRHIKGGYKLADGTVITAAWLRPSQCDETKSNSDCGDFYIKVNSKHFPLAFIINPNGISPLGTTNSIFKNYCLNGANQSRCTGWIIMNGNMDYLHCKDLDLYTKTKCK